ncbi:MAG: RNA methyltransferase [Parasporobacterium sp.]|nr:RNA methyltransferase [Parasporobacterium sp.]
MLGWKEGGPKYTYYDYDVDHQAMAVKGGKASYREIKEWIMDQYGVSVSSLYVAKVKRKHGLIERENYNKGEEGHRIPVCPPEKEKLIEEALRHFRML